MKEGETKEREEERERGDKERRTKHRLVNKESRCCIPNFILYRTSVLANFPFFFGNSCKYEVY